LLLLLSLVVDPLIVAAFVTCHSPPPPGRS